MGENNAECWTHLNATIKNGYFQQWTEAISNRPQFPF